MTIDKIVLKEVDEKLPWLSPLMNQYALHPTKQIQSDLQAYIKLAYIKVGKTAYEQLLHIYNNIEASNTKYEV